jgi:hypothetical protein
MRGDQAIGRGQVGHRPRPIPQNRCTPWLRPNGSVILSCRQPACLAPASASITTELRRYRDRGLLREPFLLVAPTQDSAATTGLPHSQMPPVVGRRQTSPRASRWLHIRRARQKCRVKSPWTLDAATDARGEVSCHLGRFGHKSVHNSAAKIGLGRTYPSPRDLPIRSAVRRDRCRFSAEELEHAAPCCVGSRGSAARWTE